MQIREIRLCRVIGWKAFFPDVVLVTCMSCSDHAHDIFESLEQKLRHHIRMSSKNVISEISTALLLTIICL